MDEGLFKDFKIAATRADKLAGIIANGELRPANIILPKIVLTTSFEPDLAKAASFLDDNFDTDHCWLVGDDGKWYFGVQLHGIARPLPNQTFKGFYHPRTWFGAALFKAAGIFW